MTFVFAGAESKFPGTSIIAGPFDLSDAIIECEKATGSDFETELIRGISIAVAVGVGLGILLAVAVGVGLEVSTGSGVADSDGVGVAIGVADSDGAGVAIGVADSDGAGVARVAIGAGAIVGIGEGANFEGSESVGEGVAEGEVVFLPAGLVGVLLTPPLFHCNFFPFFTHVNFLLLDMTVAPAFAQIPPGKGFGVLA